MKKANHCLRLLTHSALYTSAISCLVLSIAAQEAWAGPTGGTVVGSSGSSSNPANIVYNTSTSTTTINQHAQDVVIDWDSFNLNSSETVRFNQPNASSIALNRVMDSGRSTIDGKLSANGNVWIINSDGILFGKNAVVNTGGFLASTSNITKDNFISGDYNFAPAHHHHHHHHDDGTITNDGEITVADGGLAMFVAPEVTNNGTITAKLGKIQLASGNEFTVDMHGDGLISVAASKSVTSQLLANNGHLYADGGHITLTVGAATQMIDSLVNLNGIIRADASSGHPGFVSISTPGDVNINGGSIKASNSITIDNGGTFFSIPATLTAHSVSLNQNAKGSIQNAINAVSQSNNTTLNLDAGTYNQQVSLTNKSNFTLNGSGAGSTILENNNNETSVTITGGTKDKISNLSIANNSSPTDSRNSTGIDIENSSKVTLNNDAFSNLTNGVLVNNSSGVTVSNSNFTNDLIGVSAGSPQTGSKANGITVRNNQFTNNVLGIDVKNSANANIIDNTLTGTPNAIISDGKGGWKSVATTGINGGFDTNLTVSGNNVSNYGTGIEVYYNKNASIASNTVTGGNYGLYLGYNDSTMVTKNKVKNSQPNSDVGINIGSDNNDTVSNNTVSNVGTGMKIAGGSNVKVTGNTVGSFTLDGKVGDGILIQDTNGVMASYNAVENTTGDGIRVADNHDTSLIRNNTVIAAAHNTNAVGISLVDNTGNITATGNTVSGFGVIDIGLRNDTGFNRVYGNSTR